MDLEIKKPSVKSHARSDTFVLIFLDAILDTRIGVIGQKDPELAGKILTSGKYFSRNFDEFDGLTNAEFKELYNTRNEDTLPHSIVTNISFFLQRLVKDAISADAIVPNDDRLIVHLNIWPYVNLTSEELDGFVNAIRFYTYSYAEIVIINKPLTELTPKHVKENYDIVLMYDYENYIETHAEALEKTNIPLVSFVAPAMYRSELPKGEEADEIKKMKLSPFSAIEIALAPVIGLKLLPVSLFCITDQINPENKQLALDSIRYTTEMLTEIMAKANGKPEVFNMDDSPNAKEEVVKPLDEELL